nr:MAG TPA: hypothetical protein [Caudoviricetes sp.]
MKKYLCWNIETSPARMIKFIAKNKIKRKDVLAINRNASGDIEIWFWAKKFETIV